MRLVALFSLMAFTAAAEDNALTLAEKSAGWVLLFDGQTMKGWRDPAKRNPAGDAWVIDKGTLKTRPKPRLAEDLLSAEHYGDFELVFDWRVSPGGNTGLKYRLQRMIFIDDTKNSRVPAVLRRCWAGKSQIHYPTAPRWRRTRRGPSIPWASSFS